MEISHRTPPPGYTTVATIMTRLVDKGLLQRSRTGKTDVYRPVYEREEFGRRVAMAAVRGLVDEFGDVALAHRVKDDAAGLAVAVNQRSFP